MFAHSGRWSNAMTDVARDDLVRSETNVHVVVLWNCSLCSDKDDDEALEH